MKLKALMAAVAVASSANVLAAPINHFDVTVKLAGASAQKKIITAIFNSNCVSGTYNKYQDTSSAGNSKNWEVHTCTFAASLPAGSAYAALANQNVKLVYRFKGGSAYGVVHLAKQYNVEFMDPIPEGGAPHSNCTLSGSTYSCDISTGRTADVVAANDECPLTGAVSAQGSALTYCSTVDGGASDVEPSLFLNAENTPPNVPQLDDISTLTAPTTTFGQGFSVVVNSTIAGLLRTYYGTTANGFAVMPKTVATSIFTDGGGVTTWKKAISSTITATATSTMKICRRESGSGTQAAAQMFFLDQGCNTGAKTFVTFATASPLVIENDTTDKEIACLNDSSLGQTIGIVAIDSNLGSTGLERVAIDGVEPTYQNARDGKYGFSFEATMQYLASMPSGNPKLFLDLLKSEASKSTTLATALGSINTMTPTTNASVNAGAIAGAYPGTSTGLGYVYRGTRSKNSCQAQVLKAAQ